MAVSAVTKQMKIQEIEKIKIDIKDTQDRLVMDKIYVLKALLGGSAIDDSKSYSSDTIYKSLIPEEDYRQEIITKIMSLIKLL